MVPFIRNSIFCLLLLSLSTSLWAQDPLSQWAEKLRITQANQQAYIDHLGQVYLVSPKNELFKFDMSGKQLFHFTNNSLGDLAFVDVSNPLQLTLFYPDLNQVILLDRTLNPLAQIDLNRQGFFNVTALCSARDGNLWLFDADQLALVKIGLRGNVLFRSRNLQLNFANHLPFDFLREQKGRLFAHSQSTNKVLCFDIQGNYLHTWSEAPSFFQLDGDRLYFIENGHVVMMDHRDRILPFRKTWPIGEGWHRVMVAPPFVLMAKPQEVRVVEWPGS